MKNHSNIAKKRSVVESLNYTDYFLPIKLHSVYFTRSSSLLYTTHLFSYDQPLTRNLVTLHPYHFYSKYGRVTLCLYSEHGRVTCLYSEHDCVTCLYSEHGRATYLYSEHGRVTCLYSEHGRVTCLYFDQDVKFVTSDLDEVYVGSDIKVPVKIQNESSETRTVHLAVTLSSVYYTGVTRKELRREVFDFVLEPQAGMSS